MIKIKLMIVFGLTALLSCIAMIQNKTGETQPKITRIVIKQQESKVKQEVLSAKPGDEIISLRSENSKTFKISNTEFTSKYYAKPQHYYDSNSGIYIEPDMSVRNDAQKEHGKYIDPGQGLPKITWDENKPFDYTYSHPSGYSVTYHTLHNTEKIRVNIDYRTDTVKEFLTLNDRADGNTLSWELITNANMEPQEGEIKFTDSNGAFLFRTTKPWARDANGRYIPVMISLNGDTLTYRLDIPESAVYPLTVDPTTTAAESDGTTGTLQRVNQADWATARDTEDAASVDATAITAGVIQDVISGPSIFRGLLRFVVSALSDSALVDSAKVRLVYSTKAGANFDGFYSILVKTDFDLNKSAFGTTEYNDFEGWGASGDYSVTEVSDSLSCDGSHAPGDTLTFTLNEAGKYLAISGDTTQVYLHGKEDIFDTEPVGNSNRYYTYEDDSPYIQIWYTDTTFYQATATVTNIDSNYVKLVLSMGSNPDSAHVGIRFRDETGNVFYWTGTDTTDTPTSKTAAAWGDTININSGLQKDHNYWIDILTRSPVQGAWLYCYRTGARTADPTLFEYAPASHGSYSYVWSVSSANADYDSARAEFQIGDITYNGSSTYIGQRKINGGNYVVFRTYYYGAIPSMPQITEAEYHAGVDTDASTVDFQVSARIASWSEVDEETAYYEFSAWDYATKPYTGDNLFDTNSTSALAGSLLVDFSSAGLTNLNAARGSNIDILLVSEEDMTGSAPADPSDEYIELSSSQASNFIKLGWEKADAHDATAPTAIPLSDTEIEITWSDSSITNVAFVVTDSSGTVLSDTLSHDANADTLTGLSPNTIYKLKVKNVGGLYDGSFTALKTVVTYPENVSGLVTTSSAPESLTVYFTMGSNPDSTEVAIEIITTEGDTIYLDLSADPIVPRSLSPTPNVIDSLPEWGWSHLPYFVAGDGSTHVDMTGYAAMGCSTYVYVRSFDDGE